MKKWKIWAGLVVFGLVVCVIGNYGGTLGTIVLVLLGVGVCVALVWLLKKGEVYG